MARNQIGQRFSPALQAVIERALDPLHGLFTELSEERPSRQGGRVRIVRARLAPPAYFRGNAPTLVRTADDGCGAAFDCERAYWSAIGEGVERYAGSIYWPENLIAGTMADVRDAMDLEPLIVAARPEIQKVKDDEVYHWVSGLDLITGRKVHIPASLVYLGYRPTGGHEILTQNDSTGLACGQGFEDACFRGLCEVIERDAFASSWLLNRPPPRLNVSDTDLARLSQPVQDALRNPNTPVTLHYLANSFGIHVVTAIMRGDRALASVGAAAGPSLIQAAEKAVAEVLQGWQAVSALPAIETCLRLEDLKTPFDHLRFYLHSERTPPLDGYFSSSDAVAFSDIEAAPMPDLAAVLTALTGEGHQAVAVDLTTADIADLGFSVVRVIVAGFQPLIFGPACVQVVDDRRLRAWQKIWRLEPANPPSYNALPHPFP